MSEEGTIERGRERETELGVEPLVRLTRAVGARVRLTRAARAGATVGAVGLASLAALVTWDRLVGLPAGTIALLAGAGVGIPIAAALANAGRHIPALLPATLIDRTHALSGRVSVALELAAAASEDALSRLAIADAVGRAPSIAPARAFPIRAPRHLRALLLSMIALTIALTIQRPRAESHVIAAATPRLEALLVHPDDLEARRDAIERLDAAASPTEELRRAIDDTNELLEALSDRTLDRTEAIRRIAALEESLARPRPPSLVAREELLEAMGDRLGRGELTQALAEALRESDAAGAAEAMQALADRAREGDLSRSERRALREALEELAAMHETEEEQAELRDAEDAAEAAAREPESEEQQSLLEQRREEVERLRQQHEQRMEAERQLERLERELEEAAEQLGDAEQPQSAAAESMDEAAEELNRTAREQMSEEEMQQLAQQLQQLREMIRRQRRESGADGGGEGEGEGSAGSGGRSGQSQMDRFVLRARGGEGGSDGMSIGTPNGSGGGGEGESEGGTGEGGEEQEGTPGGTSGSSPGTEGEGGTGEETGEQMLVIGEGGGATLELPGFGQGHGAPTGGGEGEADRGDGAGTGHDGTTLDDPTDRGGDHRTVAVHGDDQGRGPSRSEVIRGGAATGFASRDYERVYADYAQHAEEEIEEDEIPPGYRFYVRRYFELIRPR
jgi:hypothetical protein